MPQTINADASPTLDFSMDVPSTGEAGRSADNAAAHKKHLDNAKALNLNQTALTTRVTALESTDVLELVRTTALEVADIANNTRSSAIEALNAAEEARLAALEAYTAGSIVAEFSIYIPDNPGVVASTDYYLTSANAVTLLGSLVVPPAFWGKRVMATVSSVNVRNLQNGFARLYIRQSGLPTPYPANGFVEIASYAPQGSGLQGSFGGSRVMTLPNVAHNLILEMTDSNVSGVGDLDPQDVHITLLVLP